MIQHRFYCVPQSIHKLYHNASIGRLKSLYLHTMSESVLVYRSCDLNDWTRTSWDGGRKEIPQWTTIERCDRINETRIEKGKKHLKRLFIFVGVVVASRRFVVVQRLYSLRMSNETDHQIRLKSICLTGARSEECEWESSRWAILWVFFPCVRGGVWRA